MECPALQGPKKTFSLIFLNGKETELRKLSGIFKHTFEEYKKKFLIKLVNMADLSADSWSALALQS